jgi:hypothetical protein
MALKDTLTSFIDNTGLAEVFSRKAPDPVKARKPLLDGIARTREQFGNRATTVSKAPNKWWQVRNGVVALTVKVKGDTFDINGVATNHMPEERFEEFLTKFEQAVNAGEFDDELANKGNGDAQVHIGRARKASTSKRASGDRHPSTDRKDWDSLTRSQKQKVSAFYRFGKNADGSVISEAGYKPDAPLAD